MAAVSRSWILTFVSVKTGIESFAVLTAVSDFCLAALAILGVCSQMSKRYKSVDCLSTKSLAAFFTAPRRYWHSRHENFAYSCNWIYLARPAFLPFRIHTDILANVLEFPGCLCVGETRVPLPDHSIPLSNMTTFTSRWPLLRRWWQYLLCFCLSTFRRVGTILWQ